MTCFKLMLVTRRGGIGRCTQSEEARQLKGVCAAEKERGIPVLKKKVVVLPMSSF